MSIPKEPRQLMINIMYLVLTAMLALNVSAKIFNAFKVVDKGLDKSNEALDIANASLPSLIKERAKKKPELQTYADRVDGIRATSAELTDYIDDIVNNLVDLGGNNDGTPNDADYVERGGKKELKGKKNKDVTTRYLVNEGKGNELEAKLQDIKNRFLSFVDSTEQASFASNIAIEISEDWKSDGKAKSWAEYNFKQMPLAATMPIFNKFKNDAKATEAALLNYLMGKVGGEELVLDQFTVVSAPKKSYIIKGETFETEVFLTASASKESNTGVSISINGRGIPLDNEGRAKWTQSASATGVKTYNAVATVTNPVTGEVKRYNKTFEYEVGERSATVSADKMNVMYIGVDNPITVSAAGISSNDLKVSGSGGGLTLTPNGKSKYIAKVTQPGDAKITLAGGGLPPTAYDFRVKRIPDPIAKLGRERGGAIGNGTFKAQLGVIAALDNFDFDARCSIKGFNLVRVAPRQDAQRSVNAGGNFTSKSKNLMNLAKPGDTYYFEDVKASCPGDKAARKINDMVFRIN